MLTAIAAFYGAGAFVTGGIVLRAAWDQEPWEDWYLITLLAALWPVTILAMSGYFMAGREMPGWFQDSDRDKDF